MKVGKSAAKTSWIGLKSLLPTHTPTVWRREKPMHQLARLSLRVPVFTGHSLSLNVEFASPLPAKRTHSTS